MTLEVWAGSGEGLVGVWEGSRRCLGVSGKGLVSGRGLGGI